jgi:hypothetical protein
MERVGDATREDEGTKGTENGEALRSELQQQQTTRLVYFFYFLNSHSFTVTARISPRPHLFAPFAIRKQANTVRTFVFLLPPPPLTRKESSPFFRMPRPRHFPDCTRPLLHNTGTR